MHLQIIFSSLILCYGIRINLNLFMINCEKNSLKALVQYAIHKFKFTAASELLKMLNIHLFSFPKIELDIGVALLS
jgi:hypothetical protein